MALAEKHIIPSFEFDKSQYDKEAREITVNLNNYLWLHERIEEYRRSHLRWLPSINVKSPSGTVAGFAYPTLDGADIIYRHDGRRGEEPVTLRLTFK